MKYILLILIAFYFSKGTCQITPTIEEEKMIVDMQKKIASQQIMDLKKGVLIVRLKTKENTINALKSKGKNEVAKKIENQLRISNSYLVKAFIDFYSFSEVRFIYSNQTEKITKKKFEEIDFLDKNLNIDPTITLPKNIDENKLFIAELSTLSQDTLSIPAGIARQYQEDGISTYQSFTGGANMSFSCLNIKSFEMVQLFKPFPYYVRAPYEMPKQKRANKTILKLERKLNKYYDYRR